MIENYLGLDIFASRAIYKDLVAGRIINAYEIIEGDLQPSPKFRALVDDLDKYRYIYSLQGYELQSINNEAFFATRYDRGEEYNDVAANIQVLLVVICRGVCALGIPPAILLDPNGGLSAKQIDAIGELEEQARIIKACGLRLPLTESVNGQLVNRGVCFKTKQDRYILSSAGKYLFEELFANVISDDQSNSML